ncbi:MAG: FHA domain-containing protein [Planctomycetota bacterium JB042]
MVYHLTVLSGTDEGKSFRIEGESLIGRSPAARVVLKDESVAWEHAVVREEGGKLVLQNLSAAGTKVKGRRVSDSVTLGNNDEIQLSDSVKLVVDQRLGGGGLSAEVMLLVVLVLLGLGLGAMFLLKDPDQVETARGEHNWRQAYSHLDTRMDEWREKGWFPSEGLKLFRLAWRIDQADNAFLAAQHWDTMRKALHSIPIEFETSSGAKTFSQIASPGTKSLDILMGFNRQAGATDFAATSDEVFADALVWFARIRGNIARSQIGEEDSGL